MNRTVSGFVVAGALSVASAPEVRAAGTAIEAIAGPPQSPAAVAAYTEAAGSELPDVSAGRRRNT